MKLYKVTYKNKSYKITVKDFNALLQVIDEHLSPMTYKKLKEFGYGSEDWRDLTQEEANKIVAEKTNSSTSNKENNSKNSTPSQLNSNNINKQIKFNTPTPEKFKETFEAAKQSQPADSRWRVSSDYSVNDYKDMKIYTTDGGSCVAVHNGDIVSVCKNESDKSIRGKDLIKYAVKNGGNKLDAFSGLFGFYIKNGFEPVSWVSFNEEYAPEGWKESNNNPKKEPVIFFKKSNKNNLMTLYPSVENFINKTKESKDYDKAYLVRDKSLEDETNDR